MDRKNTTFPQVIPINHGNITTNVWGGTWISHFKGVGNSYEKIGESWDFSAHASLPSSITWLGKTMLLKELIHQAPLKLLGKRMYAKHGQDFPFLIKLIDAEDNLSLQVHPPDDYARKRENDRGKTESWIVLDVRHGKDMGFLYLGFSPQVRRRYNSTTKLKAAFFEALEKANALGPTNQPGIRKQAQNMVLPFLLKRRVKVGDVFHLEPGTLHAIGKGIRLFEIQQTSNVTYRVWDWNRPAEAKAKILKPRTLHLAQARDVVRVDLPKPKNISRPGVLVDSKKAGYCVSRIVLKKNQKHTFRLNDIFNVLTVIHGDVKVNGDIFHQGRTLFVPATTKMLSLECVSKAATIFRSLPR